MARCGRFVWILLLGLCAGCSATDVTRLDLTFSRVTFSERIRPDLGALTAAQRTATLTTFSDGGSNGDELVAPLLPTETPGERGRQLRLADTLWTSGGELALSYEMVFWDPMFNGVIPSLTIAPYSGPAGGPRTKRMTVNRRGIVQPVSREFLVYEGQILDPSLFNTGFFPIPQGVLTAAIVRCTDGAIRDDPRNPPGALDQSCTRTPVSAAPCAGSEQGNSVSPATVLKCRVPVTVDTSLGLAVVDAGDVNRSVTDALPFRPAADPPALRPAHVKVVSDERVLARRLRFVSEHCTMRASPDPSSAVVDCDQDHLDALREWRICRGVIPRDDPQVPSCQSVPGTSLPMNRAANYVSVTSRWSFSVVDPATGQWTENFTDRLRAERVKIRVVRAGSGWTRYVLPDNVFNLDVGGHRCSALPEELTGHALFSLDSCRGTALSVTPAWNATDLTQPIEWTVTFIASARDNVPWGELIQPGGTRVPLHRDGVLFDDVPLVPQNDPRAPIDHALIDFHVVPR